MWFIRRMGQASKRLARHLKQSRGLLRSMVARLTTPAKLSDGTEAPYGYGLFPMTVRVEPAYSHNGGIEGFSSQFVYILKAHVSVGVPVNSDAGTPSARHHPEIR